MRHAVLGWLALLIASCLVPAPAIAHAARLKVDAMEYPWSAIGRLNVAGMTRRGHCTAVLIGPSTLLTAAHCLWNRQTGAWWAAESVHFIAAYQGGVADLHSTLRQYTVADGYVPGAANPPPDNIGRDWAIAELALPLGQTAGWLGAGKIDATPTAVIGEVGYRRESPNAMSLDFGCRLVGDRVPGSRLLWNDCAAVAGDSGGPLLVFRSDGPHIIGITVVAGLQGGRALSGAIDIATVTDRSLFPHAAAIAVDAGIGHGQGQPPRRPGPPADAPVATIRQLDPANRAAPTTETLRRLLARAATTVSPP